MKKFVACLVLFLFVLPAVHAAGAPVRVRSFNCDVRILPDGDIEVRETLGVDIPGEGEFHGIYRDIPVSTRWKERGRSRMEVLSVSVDGAVRPSDDVEWGGGGARVYQRDKGKLLKPGRHEFVLAYRMTGQVGMFEKNDELVWNVTGDGWEEPVDAAACTIRCPEGAAGLGMKAWLGEAGSRSMKGVSCSSRTEQNSAVMTFRPLVPVMPGRQLTVAASWEKGFVAPPDTSRSERTTPLLAALLAAVTLFLTAAWWMTGRDPARGVVIPRFDAPESARGRSGAPGPLSPAAVSYLNGKACVTGRTFGALLISLAVKKLCAIRGSRREGYCIDALGGCSPCLEENAVLDALRKCGGHVSTGKGGGSSEALHAMRSAMGGSLKQNFRRMWRGGGGGTLIGALFGSPWTLAGAVLSLAGLEAVLWYGNIPDEDFNGVMLGIACIAGFLGFIARSVFKGMRGMWRRGRIVPVVIFGTVFSAFFLVFAGVVGAMLLEVMEEYLDPVQLVLAFAAIVVPFLFAPIMDAPTPEAAKLRDGIEGLALYMRMAESGRMNALNAPERTMEHYERLLPYAVALGLEQAWGACFAGVVDARGGAAACAACPGVEDCGSFSEAVEGSASAGGSPSSDSAFGGGGGGAGGGGGGGGGGGC